MPYELDHFPAAEGGTAMPQSCPSAGADQTFGRGRASVGDLTPNSPKSQSVDRASTGTARGLIDVLWRPDAVATHRPPSPPSVGPMAPNTSIDSTLTLAAHDPNPVLFDLPASEWLEHEFQQAAKKAASMMLATPRHTPVTQTFGASACPADRRTGAVPPLSHHVGRSCEAWDNLDYDGGAESPFFAEVDVASAGRTHVQEAPVLSPGPTPNSGPTMPDMSTAQPCAPRPLTVPSPISITAGSTNKTGAAQKKRLPKYFDTKTNQRVHVQNEHTVAWTTLQGRRLVDVRTGRPPTKDTQECVTYNVWSYRKPVNAFGVTVPHGTPGSKPHNEYMKEQFSLEETAEINKQHGLTRHPRRPLSRRILYSRTRLIDVDTGRPASETSSRTVPYYEWEGRLVVAKTGELATHRRARTVTYAEYVKSKNARTKTNDVVTQS
jgi:hypothetical protein